MSLADYIEKEPERKSKYEKSLTNGSTDPEGDALFGSHEPFSPALLPPDREEEQALMEAADGLTNVAAHEKYPRGLAHGEDVFLKTRRERFIKHLMQAGKPDYADKVKEMMVTFYDLDKAELDQKLLIAKLLEYNDKTFDLIKFIDVGELLSGDSDAGNKKQSGKGLLELAMEDLFAEKRQLAEQMIVEHQTKLGMTKSSISLSDAKVTDWIITNIEEYKELRYDLTTIASVTRTFRRFLWQINRAALSNERLITVYPR